MSKRIFAPIAFTFLAIVCASANGQQLEGAAHSQGNLQLVVSNRGDFGTGILNPDDESSPRDPYTGDSVFGCVYPRDSHHAYLAGSINIGAIVKGDTLVSNLWEMIPAPFGEGQFTFSSMDISSVRYSPKARSALDLECTIHDSLIHLPYQVIGWDTRLHIPIGLSIHQHSMAWSGGAVDDFVILDYTIQNISQNYLDSVYVGYDVFARAYDVVEPDLSDGSQIGLIRSLGPVRECFIGDSVLLPYVMSNDGDPINGRFTRYSPRAAVGILLLGTSADSLVTNFNWWTGTNNLMESFGPRRKPTIEDPFRPVGPFLGQPYKDANLYYMMAHPEVDYDLMFTAEDHEPMGWLPPPGNADDIATHSIGRFLLSFGPINIPVKDKITFTIAVVGGDNVHTDPTIQFDPYQPQYFYDQLNFSELAQNARWAQWVYDNPGFDTDSDGYRGEFRICEGDTIWYKGDGVPDFRGNSPPPAPYARVLTEPGRLIVRFNGFLSETTKDVFSGLVDFEGYRVYLGLDDRRSSLSLQTSYDRLNFFRLKYHELGSNNAKWLNDDPPYSLDSLRLIHDDPDFDPLRYDRTRPLIEGDSVFRFEPVDGNQYQLGLPHGIRKAFPDATDPGLDSTLWTESDITREHDGRALPKFYEYEYVMENLLPTVPYYVSVTAFDFGYAGGRGNLPPDESNPLNSLILALAQTSANEAVEREYDVYVYPNPYRGDADYHDRGYENRKGNIIPDRARLLHFGNLPHRCKISIFSLDGDLIGVKHHDYAPDDPSAMHDSWNLVSRSGLAVESGLYYYVVESDTRTQMGKFVILK